MGPDEFERIQGEIREIQLEIQLVAQSEKLELFSEALKSLVVSLDGIEIRDTSFESAYELAKGLVDGYRNKNH